MGHDTFICYDSGDKPLADAVCAALEANGIRCWVAPRDFPPDLEQQEAVARAIRASLLMVAVVPRGANPSHQFSREIGEAIAGGILVVPFRVAEASLAESPADPVADDLAFDSHWLDGLTPAVERRLRQLASGVRALLGADGAEPHLAPVPTLLGPSRTACEAPTHVRRGWWRYFRPAFISALTSGAVATVIASTICWVGLRRQVAATRPAPPPAAPPAQPASTPPPSQSPSPAPVSRAYAAHRPAPGPAPAPSATAGLLDTTPTSQYAFDSAKAGRAVLTHYRQGIKLEAAEPARALAEYLRIKGYPQEFWPSDLEIRIRTAQLRQNGIVLP